jgi:rod shape-determining protein MreC
VATAAGLGSRLDAGLLAGCVVLSIVAIALPSQAREPISSSLRRTIVAPLVGMQRSAEQWRTAWVSNEIRQAQADSLAMRAVKAQALIAENDQLRRVIGLGSRLQWGFVPAEALHSTAPSEDVVTTLTLSAGSSAGISRYSPVVAPEGLVGIIQSADPSMSIAILYTNPDFRASTMSADGSAFGIIYPHSSGGSGEDAYMLELHGVPSRATLKPGEMVYTSGLGGTFPRGIAIGTIVSELKTPEVWTKTYLVRPAVTPSRLTTVLVLTAQRVTQGTGNIWGALSNPDSATRHIVAAGDSITRMAAQLQARARAAALDSVRQATIDSLTRLGAITPGGQAAPVVRDSSLLRPRVPAQTAPRPAAPRPDTTARRRDTTAARRDTIRPDTTRTPRTLRP